MNIDALASFFKQGPSMSTNETPRMHMGSDLLDLLVGGAKGVMGLPYGVVVNVIGDKSAGKAQPLHTRVLTPQGWKKMGDMKVGDIVCTPSKGENAKVLGVYPQGERDVYRFTFNDGTTADTADNHYWVMQSANQYSSAHKSALGKGRGQFLMTTKELADLYEGKGPKPADRMALPLVDPITFDYPEKPRIPAYLMGLLIAEGNLTAGMPVLSNPEADVIEAARKCAESIGFEFHKVGDDSITYRVVLGANEPGRSWMPDYIRELGLDCKSVEKHIPPVYLYASIQDRIDLLHGLFDGDGWVTKSGRAVYSSSSKQLAEDVAALARGLGLRATVSQPHTPFYVKDGKRIYCQDHYRVHLNGSTSILPFSSSKHLAKWDNADDPTFIKQRRILQTVEYLGKMPCQCIYIDHPLHLYLMDNYTPTHNTFVKNEILACNYHKYPGRFHWFSDDCESGDTFDTTGLYGVNLRPVDKDGNFKIGSKKVDDSTSVEDMDAHVSLFLSHMNEQDKNALGIYALDSLDGLTDATKQEMEVTRMNQLKSGKEVKDDGDYGTQIPKFLSQHFFKNKHHELEAMNTSLIIVSQIRDKLNAMGYGPKWEVSCGKALEFYCHTRIFLTTIRKIEREGRVVGAYISAKTIKSKTPRPFREVRYTVYFDYGIDNIGSNLDFLFDLREKDGKFNDGVNAIKWEGGADLSKDNLVKWLEENGLMAEVRAANKAAGNSNQVSMKFAQEWLQEQFKARPEIEEKYVAFFGRQYTRDQLIEMCENDPVMDAELTRRVVEKWEALETAAATHRRSKYAAVPSAPAEDVVAASM